MPIWLLLKTKVGQFLSSQMVTMVLIGAIVSLAISGFVWIRHDAVRDALAAEKAKNEQAALQLLLTKAEFERDAANAIRHRADENAALAMALANERQAAADGWKTDLLKGVAFTCPDAGDPAYRSRMQSIRVRSKK